MKTLEQELAFLKELTELSNKHGMIITGCGCCGSPALEHMKEAANPKGHYVTGAYLLADITYIKPGDWEWDKVQKFIKENPNAKIS